MRRTAGPDQDPIDSAASTWRSLVEATGLAWVSAPGALVARVVLALVSGLVPLSAAWLTKVVLDRLASPGEPLLGTVVLLAGTGIVAVMAPQCVRFVEADMRRSIALTVKQRLYAAVGRLDGLRRFEDPVFHDRLQLAGSAATTGPSDLVTSALGVAQGVLGVAGFVVTLGILNPWMPLIVAVATLPTLRAEMLLSRRRAATMWGLSHASRREFFYTGILTSAHAAQEVRLYGLGALFGTRMVRELRTINEQQHRMDRHELYVQAALGLCGALVAGGGLIWAVEAARVGALTIGDVSVFVAAVAGVQGGLSLLVSHLGEAHQAMLLFGHYRYVIEAGPDLPSPPTVRPAPPLRRGIELRDVWFRYGDDLPWVLRGVNLTIPAGQATALVGRNGAGKSTLVKLLCRFYDPTRGSVTWDGDDIRNLSIADLRRRLGVVFQEFMTYDLSASENIGVGSVEAMDDQPRIEAVARRAGCHETLAALPRGYQTMLTRIYLDNADRDDPGTGVVLSGGQWQRVALARGLLRDDCDLLILDEPSAGLDAEAEHQVHTQLREHRAGRTSLLISHRLNTVRDADSIVVLRDGEVAESGDHTTLMATGGVYAELFALQASGYSDSDPDEADQDSGTPVR